MSEIPIREWIDRQPNKPMATYAAAMARVGVDLPQMMAQFGKRWPGAAPDAGDWIRLYRNHRSVAGAVQGALPGGPDTMLIADSARAFRNQSPEELRVIAESITPEDDRAACEAGQEQAALFQAGMEAIAYNKAPSAKELAANGVELSVELRFFMQVVLPYLIEYGDLPARDFASARRGDLAALERVMAIDPAIIAEPRIAEQIAGSFLQRNTSRLRLLADGMLKRQPSVKACQCKMLMAAMIVALFENAKVRISVADIRGLYDSIAKANKGVLTDSDLPDSPESMSKGIQRYKKFCRPIIGRMARSATGQKLP